MVQQQVRELWEISFHEEKAFTDLYFKRRYNDKLNVPLVVDGSVVAALQIIPYPMSFLGEKIRVAYLSGVCVHPAYRHRGLMTQLLTKAYHHAHEMGFSLCALIPAERWLFEKYGKCGFSTVFYNGHETFHKSAIPAEPVDIDDKEAWPYLEHKLNQRDNYIQHRSEDLSVIAEAMKLEHIRLYSIKRKGNVVAAAVGDSDRIGELVFDTLEARDLLLSAICEAKDIDSISLISANGHSPFGMARIIDTNTILGIYAKRNPQKEMVLHVTDNQIEVNNIVFSVSDGVFQKISNRQAQSITIADLTSMVFEGSNAYMSLMLN